MNYFHTIVFAFISMLPLHGQGTVQPYAEAEVTSRHLIPGEQTHLIIRLRNARPESRPAPPEVTNTSVNFVRTVTQISNRRHLTQVFLYRLTPAKTGKYTIPPVIMTSGGKEYASQPVSFEVHDPTTLISLPSGQAGKDILAGWFPAKTTLYQGEQCPLTLKLYIPQQLHPVNWGLPEPEKNNCLAWRFTPPSVNELGKAHIDGIPYRSARYTTTISGISPGIATFGPTRHRIIIRQRTIDPRFGSRISDSPANLTLPKLDFNILPLPPGAPVGFHGAVGEFQISAECQASTLDDTDSAEVILQVAGTGNLENIQSPGPTGKGWKVIDTSKVTRGQERRFISGVVTFRQLLRPDPKAPLPSSIPPYSFSFFNPDEKSYHTLTTAAIPVNIIRTAKQSSSDPNGSNRIIEKTGTPPEDMRNIVGFIDKPDTDHHSPPTGHRSAYWHLLPALVCLTIIAIPILRRIKTARAGHPDDQRKHTALKKLAEPTDTRTFYRRAGRFIDQWLTRDEELDNVLAERDELCFLPDDSQIPPVTDHRKHEIIALLKRHAKLTLILMLACIIAPSIQAAEKDQSTHVRDAWKSGHYQQAIDLYLKQYPDPANTPADVLYNIGNCHHRLDQPGHAALAWRRALAQQPSHHKARQNLRYTELQEGSNTPTLSPWQQYLTNLPLQAFRGTLHASLWLLLISILILTLIRPKRSLGPLILAFLMPITATLGAIGIHYYPDTDVHTSFHKQAVTLDKTMLYSEAHRQDTAAVTLPPASLVTITATRGPWIHVNSPDGQSGWVESRSISPVLPTK